VLHTIESPLEQRERAVSVVDGRFELGRSLLALASRPGEILSEPLGALQLLRLHRRLALNLLAVLLEDLDHVIKRIVPALRSFGFKGSGQTYRKAEGDVTVQTPNSFVKKGDRHADPIVI
jgi:hypothetical protein